jgi:hypothetical protein
LSGKDYFLDSLGEDIDSIAVDDYPDLYRSYTISNFLQLTKRKLCAIWLISACNYTHSLLSFFADTETEQKLVLMFFLELITIEEFTTRIASFITSLEIRQVVCKIVAEVFKTRKENCEPLLVSNR